MGTDPDRLGAVGAALRDVMAARFEFTDAERLVLVEVCRTLDVLDALDRAVAARGTYVLGSKAQDVLNPAIAEARQQRASLVRLVGALNLPAGEGVDAFTTAAARKAARARWAADRAAKGGA